MVDKIGITDKVVSQWEKDKSIPNPEIIEKLAVIFGVSVDEMNGHVIEERDKEMNRKNDLAEMMKLILSGVGVAMGVAVFVLSKLKELDITSATEMLSLGVFCVALSSMVKTKK